MEAWLLWNPTGWEFKWDALAGFFGALLALFVLERKDHSVPTQTFTAIESVTPTDIHVFEKLLALLDPNRVILFLREHDFGGSFSRDDIAPLKTFVAVGKNPDSEFIDPAIEKERKILLEAARKLVMALGKNTSPTSSDNLSVLPSHLVNSPRPDWVIREAKELNEASTAFVDLYDNFIRFCRLRIAKSTV
ncbi:MAG: hypothetical protein B7Y04_11710 [Gallionellales bacterium 24-53-125]|jgi:hypothetical protein|nr:MAG: hypothetical protein B7Y04_11710 [Gallionellales bacterium 24-53-125]